MKNKFKIKTFWIIAIVILVLIGIILIILRSPEDSWIKDSRGVWVKHGTPSSTPDEVLKQQQVILCSMELYASIKAQGVNFSSQCLGACGNYSIDIVNVPRTAEDNNVSNQCPEYIHGETSNFIEMDKLGNIVRVN